MLKNPNAGKWLQVRDYGKQQETIPVPILTRLQQDAWDRFLQRQIKPEERQKIGLHSILNEAFPIKSPNADIWLEYLYYELGDPRYKPQECRDLRLTYGLPLKVKLRLHRGDKGVIEEFVFFGEVPLMLGGGEFIINGAERVIVTQLHRSPGVDFSEEALGGERKVQTCWIIPERGSWIEIAVSKKDTLNVHIDQSGKFSAMTFLRAMWDLDEHNNPIPKFSSNEEIIRRFYNTKIISLGEVAEPDRLNTKRILNDFLGSLKPNSKPMPDRIGLGEKPEIVEIPLPKRSNLLSSKKAEIDTIVIHKEKPFIAQSPEPVKVAIDRTLDEIPDEIREELLYYRLEKPLNVKGKIQDKGTLITEDLLENIFADKKIDLVVRTWGINLNSADEEDLEYSHRKFDTGFTRGKIKNFLATRKKAKFFRDFNQILNSIKFNQKQFKNWEKIFYLGDSAEKIKKEAPKNIIKKLIGKKIAEQVPLSGGRTVLVNKRLAKEDINMIFQAGVQSVKVFTKIDLNTADMDDLIWSNEQFQTGFTDKNVEKFEISRKENGPFLNFDDARKGTGIKQTNFKNWEDCFTLLLPEDEYIEAPEEFTILLENWKAAENIEIAPGKTILAGTYLNREQIDLIYNNEEIESVTCWQYNLNIINHKRLYELNHQLDFNMGRRAGDICRKIADVLKSGPLRNFNDFLNKIKLPKEVSDELNKFFYFGPKEERDEESVKLRLIKALLGKRLASDVALPDGKVLIAKYRRLTQADIEDLYNTPEIEVVLVLKPEYGEDGEFFIDPPNNAPGDVPGEPNIDKIFEHMLRPIDFELNEKNEKTILTHFLFNDFIMRDKRPAERFTKLSNKDLKSILNPTDKKKKAVKQESKVVTARFCSKVNKEWIIAGQKKKGSGKEELVKELQGKYTVAPVIDPKTGEHIIDQFMLIPKEKAEVIIQSRLHEIEVINEVDDHLILNALADDPSTSHEDALVRIYTKLRQGTPPNLDKARQLFNEKFYDDQRYKLGSVGRFRLNRKFNSDISEEKQTLQQDDLANVIEYILLLRGRKSDGKIEAAVDDIDHLGNRRVKTIEELVSDELRKGFLKLKKSVIDKMNSDQADSITPRTLINSKAITTAINYFFARGELSQVVDQTNPLAQLTHERRLSALGPGGLNRKRAGFEVRDVHISHYGRICPIETPEGANIGLISSLSIYSRIDKYGFLTTPYRVVKNKIVTGEIVHLRADQEIDTIIAPADVEIDEHLRLVQDVAMIREGDEYKFVPSERIQYIDISPRQMVGVSASLIPFLEHDDTARALMGSNMQRQSVPLITTEPPRVATGMEMHVPKNSGMCRVAEQDGTVVYRDSLKITIKDKNKVEHTYELDKFVGLNDRSCLTQKPIVKLGQKVKKGEVIADGPSTKDGELSLGKNVTVAFMTWDGYNFEDAIIMSERLVHDDVYTSIHIDEFEKEIRETKLGKEEFTSEIPNVSQRARRYLDLESGLVALGTKVTYDDILVGKISPKSKSEMTAEEKLLHAIFGKAGDDVKDDSFRVPSGTEGIVIKTQKFARKSALSDEEKKIRKKELEKAEEKFYKTSSDIISKLLEEIKNIIGKQLKNLGPMQIHKKVKFDEKTLRQYRMHLNFRNIENTNPEASEHKHEIEILLKDTENKIDEAEKEYNKVVNRVSKGDELPTGVLEKARVVVATRRTLSVGDKFAGRHGNKGVVSIILPVEDMPFMDDGTPVDIILNPLGVPSRMNVGQILELHLGWASYELGMQSKTPVFAGATEKEVEQALKEADLPLSGKIQLFDGRTGRPFDQETAVGQMYMLKLHHLVDDKVHARATGPYSLITQQPLGGKARFGGQRFGEMEVWALEAYGAASILQEMLTVKSDDVEGRTKIYESMVKGINTLEAGTPVSFDVLCSEIKGLALNIELFKKDIELEEDVRLMEYKKRK